MKCTFHLLWIHECQWRKQLSQHWKVILFYFQHISGIPTPMENSNILTRDFCSVRLATLRMTYHGSSSIQTLVHCHFEYLDLMITNVLFQRMESTCRLVYPEMTPAVRWLVVTSLWHGWIRLRLKDTLMTTSWIRSHSAPAPEAAAPMKDSG